MIPIKPAPAQASGGGYRFSEKELSARKRRSCSTNNVERLRSRPPSPLQSRPERPAPALSPPRRRALADAVGLARCRARGRQAGSARAPVCPARQSWRGEGLWLRQERMASRNNTLARGGCVLRPADRRAPRRSRRLPRRSTCPAHGRAIRSPAARFGCAGAREWR